jgi:hypothetical protein
VNLLTYITKSSVSCSWISYFCINISIYKSTIIKSALFIMLLKLFSIAVESGYFQMLFNLCNYLIVIQVLYYLGFHYLLPNFEYQSLL